MCMEYSQYADKIKNYCDNNGLDFSKIKKKKKMIKGCGEDDIIFQYHDPEKGKMGLLDETPAPVVLKIIRMGSNIKFEQTEYTHKYLS